MFAVEAISKLESVVPWDWAVNVTKCPLINGVCAAAGIIGFGALIAASVRQFVRQGFTLEGFVSEYWLRMLIVGLLFANPVGYKAVSIVYAKLINSVYETTVKESYVVIKPTVAELARTISEATNSSILNIGDVITGKILYMPVLQAIVSIIVNAAMILYWLLCSMVPIYLVLVVIIVPILAGLSFFFDDMAEKIVMMYVSGIMTTIFIGITLRVMGMEMQYYMVSEMIKGENPIGIIMLSSLIIGTTIGIPLIMRYLFRNGIFDMVGALMMVISIVAIPLMPATIKTKLLKLAAKAGQAGGMSG